MFTMEECSLRSGAQPRSGVFSLALHRPFLIDEEAAEFAASLKQVAHQGRLLTNLWTHGQLR